MPASCPAAMHASARARSSAQWYESSSSSSATALVSMRTFSVREAQCGKMQLHQSPQTNTASHLETRALAPRAQRDLRLSLEFRRHVEAVIVGLASQALKIAAAQKQVHNDALLLLQAQHTGVDFV